MSSHYYRTTALAQLRGEPHPQRVLYWACRWHEEGVWNIGDVVAKKYHRLYTTYETNPLAMELSTKLAAAVLKQMLEVEG